MVNGLEKFRDYFQDYTEDYVLIGGVACELALNSLRLEFRPTDDFDIVEEGDELYEIIEDTTQVVVSFPIISDIELEEKLPFFRALSLKLASL